ncbi:MAG: hypothetical protein IPJ61_18090 [Tessaracoccus sp.]|nr:hypothetical protein [Tessaracoccus sp.]MBK7822904.1 hypothetical protein [Tessaracoccus sp.]
MEDSWRLFFDDDLNELFVDAPLAEDPQGTSAFEAWALALCRNMRGRR